MKNFRRPTFACRLNLPFVAVPLFLLASFTGAQNILLKTGQTIETRGVRRSGDMVMGKVQVGASSGEVGYQTATISKIDFPEPPQLKTTAAFLSQGQSSRALAEIEPIVKYYGPFRDLPGNWWAQGALLKVSALSGMQLDKQAEALGDEIRRSVTDPETVRAAQLQLVAGLVRKEDYARHCATCDSVIRKARNRACWPRLGSAKVMRSSPKCNGTEPPSPTSTYRFFTSTKNSGCRPRSSAVRARFADWKTGNARKDRFMI